ncbi:protein SON [Hippocampus zosterae]|uniref:protein SON n=1 Tax=Hippocampus zosterae TaxID=109293 RepID=UPI00223E1DA1|nr:protein SON [Hippocampus zosterae]
MAANIEQIFQDFILNKIREIEDENVDKTAPQGVAACNEITSEDNKDKNCDDKSSKKKHKKHKKHKSKKKKQKREKEAKENSSESEEEFDAHSRKVAPTDNEQPCQGLASSSKSHKHKTGKKKKKKKKRKRHKSERRGNSSDSDTKQRRSKCAPSLLPRPCEELPDIIPKQDSSSGAKADGGKRRRSRSHSHGSHSSPEGWSSRPGKRKARSRSRSISQGHRTSSRSLDTRDGLDPSTESKDDAAKRIPPLSPSSKKRDVVEQQSLDHNHVAAETTAGAAGEHSVVAEDCAAPPSVPNPPSRAQRSEEPVEPAEPRPKASERVSASARKSPPKKPCKPSKSPSRSREEKSSKRQKRSSSPRRNHRMRSSSRSRSRSSSRRKRARSRSRNRRSRRSRSVSRDGRRRGTYSQRDRWKREPSSSPELILRKKRSPTWKHGANLDGSQQISDLGKEQLLEIAKANAAAMCAKVGMAIPASLRSSMLPLAFPSMAMNAAMTAATMTAALSNINTLSSLLPLPTTTLLPLPTITNKPPGAHLSSSINAALEEVKKKVTKQANSISIKEFTDKCKMIVDSKGELPVAEPYVDEEDRKPFGGLVLREHKAISFNVINTTVRPTARSDAGKAKEFPVSSGSQHRIKESKTMDAYGDWVPVEKTSDETKSAAVPQAAASSSSGTSESLKEAELPGTTESSAVDDDSVFPGPPPQPVDISQAVSERIKAQKRLAENPYDVNAICMLSRAQEQVDAWAQSNTVPGLFTGTTGAQVLSSEELSNSGPQAWLKKDQFLRAAPVSGGVGEFLMRKMGWRAGEGLGRNREGTVEPIIIDFKVDRKGLVAEGEKPQKPTGGLVVTKDLMGKHPVSALIELCTKKRMTQPDFVMVHHSGPDHRKNFLFKVTVNGVDYQPQTASPNKKHAKAMAATVALQALGEVPADGPGLYTGPVFTAASTGPLFST